MSIQLIHNERDQDHLRTITSKLKTATDTFIAVALLRQTGLGQFVEPLKKAINNGCVVMLIGTNMDTDPEVLQQLLKLSKKVGRKKLTLHIIRWDALGSAIFHPKYYRMSKGKKHSIIVGSANATGQGLTRNEELSVCISETGSTAFVRSCKTYEKRLLSHRGCKVLSKTLLEEYRSQRPRLRKAARNLADLTSADKERLLRARAKYLSDADARYWAGVKDECYQDDLPHLFDDLIRTKGKRDFTEVFEDIIGTFHSSGLDRSKGNILKNHRVAVSLVKEIMANARKTPEDLFAIYYDKRDQYGDKLHGFGTNLVTEFMNVCEPKRFAVVNNRSVGLLKSLGLSKIRHPGSFTPADYGEFCFLARDLQEECGFEDLARLDHFFSWSYSWEWLR